MVGKSLQLPLVAGEGVEEVAEEGFVGEVVAEGGGQTDFLFEVGAEFAVGVDAGGEQRVSPEWH